MFFFFLWLTYAWVVCANVQCETNFQWLVVSLMSLMYLSQVLFGNSILSTLSDDVDQRPHSYLSQIVLWTLFFFPADLFPLVQKNQKAFCFTCILIFSFKGTKCRLHSKTYKMTKMNSSGVALCTFHTQFFLCGM